MGHIIPQKWRNGIVIIKGDLIKTNNFETSTFYLAELLKLLLRCSNCPQMRNLA